MFSASPEPSATFPSFYDFKRAGKTFFSKASTNVDGTEGRPALLTGATSVFASKLMENLSN